MKSTLMPSAVADAYVRRMVKVLIDLAACTAAVTASYLLRFPFQSALERMHEDAHLLIIIIGLQLIGFSVLRLYSALWRYTGYHSLLKLMTVTSASLTVAILLTYVFQLPGLPRSIVALNWFLANSLCAGVRLLQRHAHAVRSRRGRPPEADQRVLIYGAGNAGENLLRSIEMAGDIHIHVVGFVDDDPLKLGNTMRNRQVLGDRRRIGELVRRYRVSDLYLAMPSLSGKQFRDLLETVQAQVAGRVRVHTLPGIVHLANGRVSVDQVRKVEIADLLRRSPVHLDDAPLRRMLQDQPVMVVGGGGSIGQELCRQIAQLAPGRLVIVDSSEYNTYRAEALLKQEFPQLELVCLVADAANRALMQRVFTEHRPTYVFHAAAYKHVPLMEANPWAAVVNNLNSTLVLCEMAVQFHVQRFVLVSSDKAVRPSSVMGATKRICEIITLTHNRFSATEFLAVRFGNVLGSSGSVIPKFAEQIAAGGPVTVTHPDITRYFMLIPEAVELVLQAAAVGERGNIYVLDMGEPVRIADLARHMIKLSGADPDSDIHIEYTGLRPGEKLHEILYFEGDETATQIPNLFVLAPKLTAGASYLTQARQFVNAACDLDYGALLAGIRDLAPEFRPAVPETLPAPQPERKSQATTGPIALPILQANG